MQKTIANFNSKEMEKGGRTFTLKKAKTTDGISFSYFGSVKSPSGKYVETIDLKEGKTYEIDLIKKGDFWNVNDPLSIQEVQKNEVYGEKAEVETPNQKQDSMLISYAKDIVVALIGAKVIKSAEEASTAWKEIYQSSYKLNDPIIDLIERGDATFPEDNAAEPPF